MPDRGEDGGLEAQDLKRGVWTGRKEGEGKIGRRGQDPRRGG